MRRALLVGIDNYEFAPLSGCVNDATNMTQLLSYNEDGSPNFDCKLFTAPEEFIKKKFINKQIKVLFNNEADVALLYFAGHGSFDELGGYLVTQDSSNGNDGIAMHEVLSLANKSKVREVVIILDCCFSGSFGSTLELDKDKTVLREGVSILTASRASQPAVEIGGSGLFTFLLRSALNGGAADICGNITVASVYAFVDQALGAWEQRPLFKSHVSRFTPLRKCNPDIELSILRLLTKYFPNPDYEFNLDPSFEPDAEPKNEEHQEIFSHLQMYRASRLVVPMGEKHMYYAAMKCKSCKLTPIGQYYWYLADRGKI